MCMRMGGGFYKYIYKNTKIYNKNIKSIFHILWLFFFMTIYRVYINSSTSRVSELDRDLGSSNISKSLKSISSSV